jgi:acetyltransferase-like isoleucine patch superfamily enzyme
LREVHPHEGPKGGWKADHPLVTAASAPVGAALVAPLLIAYRLRLVSFRTAGQMLSLVPGPLGILLRRAWYERTLASCGRRIRMMFGSLIHNPHTRVGDDCWFGESNRVGFADIGTNFMSGHNVVIVSGRHAHAMERSDVPISMQPVNPERVTIGQDVWIGVGATIGADVAPHTVVGMGAVVTATFPEWSILGGVPARVIGERA